MNIITLTLNPAFDLHIECKDMNVGAYNTARFLRLDAAGKGVNLSRALSSYGVDNLCYMVLGREDAEEFLSPIRARGINLSYTLTDGRTRRNINVHNGNKETVIALDGPPLGEREISDMEKKIIPLIDEHTVICFSGRISPTTDKTMVLSSLYRMKEAGAKFVIDSASFTLEEIISLKPYLIKPNEAEAEALTGLSVCADRAPGVAEAIRDMGCEYVLLTVGKGGAYLAAPGVSAYARAPEVRALSTVGAGDSAIAGFLAARANKLDDIECLRYAVAFGTSACMEEGSLPPDPCRIKEMIQRVGVVKF